MDINNLFENNQNWVKEKGEGYFSGPCEGQSPKLLYIGCADSRVAPEAMLGLGLGDVFVHRNVANLVVNTDLNFGSVLEYAVNHLKVDHIAVCGHTKCGGVDAAMKAQTLGILDPWLRNIRDVYRLHQAELDAISDQGDRYNRLIELNVREQCINLIKTDSVQKAHKERGLKIHGWVYDICSGNVIDQKIDIEAETKNIWGIYDLG